MPRLFYISYDLYDTPCIWHNAYINEDMAIAELNRIGIIFKNACVKSINLSYIGKRVYAAGSVSRSIKEYPMSYEEFTEHFSISDLCNNGIYPNLKRAKKSSIWRKAINDYCYGNGVQSTLSIPVAKNIHYMDKSSNTLRTTCITAINVIKNHS